jgi:ubiquitin-like protein Nedd8
LDFDLIFKIEQVKQALQEKEGIMMEQIRLIFGGKQLSDEMKISDYNLEAGSTIHMVLQLRGGQ